ncbi:MAG: hypothetical protein M1113_05220 [Candidatus Thermoplasmatota archaeon]|nr:hypothetical protein [Candidatus Thermoplasmatota archaeon]
MPNKLIAETRTSKSGFSFRMTLSKEIADELNVSESEHFGLYEIKGEIVVRKIE